MAIPAKEKIKRPKLIAVTADIREESVNRLLKDFNKVFSTINPDNIQSLIASEVSSG